MNEVGLRSMKTSRSFSDETLEAPQVSWMVFLDFLAKSCEILWCFFKDLNLKVTLDTLFQ